MWETVTKTQDLDNRFKYHKADAAKGILHEDMREGARQLAKLIDTYVPDGREKSTALTKVEEAMMWANAGIARN